MTTQIVKKVDPRFKLLMVRNNIKPKTMAKILKKPTGKPYTRATINNWCKDPSKIPNDIINQLEAAGLDVTDMRG